MTVDRFGKVLLLSAGLAVVCNSAVRAESTSAEEMKEVLARMRAMEEKMASQEKEIGNLKGKLKQAEAYSAAKPDIHMQVNKAIASKTASDKIFHDPELHPRDIKMGGYLDVAYQANLSAPDTHDNVERVFDRYDDNDFNVHLAKLYFDGTAQEQGEAGFRIDLAFGTDPNLFEATHNGDSSLTSANTTDNFSLEQAYIDYIIPFHKGIRLKAGKFVTPIGYEVIEAHDNWNSTRSFNFGKAIPFTHTGVGFEAQIFDSWALKGYLVNGWDNVQDNNNGKTFIIQSVYTPVKWFTWTLNGAVGNEKSDSAVGGGFSPASGYTDKADEDTRYLINTVMTFTPWENLSFALDASYGIEENATNNAAEENTPGFGNFGSGSKTNFDYGDAQWWGVAGYIKYNFWKRFYVAVRGEYFNDYDGTRSAYAAGGDSLQGAVQQRVELYSATVTVNYNVTKSFDVRVEYRYDAASRDVFYGHDVDDSSNPPGWQVNHTGTGGFLDRKTSQDTIGLSFLYKF